MTDDVAADESSSTLTPPDTAAVAVAVAVSASPQKYTLTFVLDAGKVKELAVLPSAISDARSVGPEKIGVLRQNFRKVSDWLARHPFAFGMIFVIVLASGIALPYFLAPSLGKNSSVPSVYTWCLVGVTVIAGLAKVFQAVTDFSEQARKWWEAIAVGATALMFGYALFAIGGFAEKLS